MREHITIPLVALCLLGLAAGCEQKAPLDERLESAQQALRVDDDETAAERREEIDDVTANAPAIDLHADDEGEPSEPIARGPRGEEIGEDAPIPAEGDIGTSPRPDPRPTLEGAANPGTVADPPTVQREVDPRPTLEGAANPGTVAR